MPFTPSLELTAEINAKNADRLALDTVVPAHRKTMDLDGTIKAKGFFFQNTIGLEEDQDNFGNLEIFTKGSSIYLTEDQGIGIGTLDPEGNALFVNGSLKVDGESDFENVEAEIVTMKNADIRCDVRIGLPGDSTNPAVDSTLKVLGISEFHHRVTLDPTATERTAGFTFPDDEFLLTVNGPTNITGNLKVDGDITGNINGAVNPSTFILPFGTRPTETTPGVHGQMIYTRSAIYIFTPLAALDPSTPLSDLDKARGKWERAVITPISDLSE